MQVGLIQRYLGNKSSISNEIVSAVRSVASPGDLIVDAFSGSLAVSTSLRNAGFEVACNDVNHFSWLYANAFFSGTQAYAPNGLALPAAQRQELWYSLSEELTAPYTTSFPKGARRTDIFDHYCEAGKHSAFLSIRGTSGRRRFFSAENAEKIDRALSKIRFWYRSGKYDLRTRCILTAMLLSAVEKISNTQGTYHDFPRDFIDSRALKPIDITVPPEELFQGIKSRFIGEERDSLEFIPTVPEHKVLYLDPPYNFRQYTSYYFMLNLLSSYAGIEDLDKFFSRIEFVRGQNMDTDFKSSFCSKSSFVPSLKRLIQGSKTEYVILSYFDGRNHWGQFKSAEGDRTGREILEDFFRSELFDQNSLTFTPVLRTNYQSYGGHKAKKIQEYLFMARKSSIVAATANDEDMRWTGTVSTLGRKL
ncbi:DNA adenine methylase (plasmid) [Acetobacter orientalis]|uniref:DNA adenine methylase n=1 Tax=Acetobacter orientalis TaxID=146474 RepID=UPI003869E810